MAEGAGVVILEAFDHAKARGAHILAEVIGYGRTSDAYHITAPDSEGNGATKAMSLALNDARLKPQDISYINAHGTSTELNDKVETLAIKKVFGPAAKQVAISSTKSHMGHLLGAAGGVEAIVITATGCGTAVKNYGHHLARDPAYAEKAKRVSALTKDISEVIIAEQAKLKPLCTQHPALSTQRRVAFQSPCSLQHGLRLKGNVEALLAALGYSLTPVPDAHLCCGAAGTYSILQPELSQKLLANKIAALTRESPAAILTANIGCQVHLQTATDLPVRHWIEALDERLSPSS